MIAGARYRVRISDPIEYDDPMFDPVVIGMFFALLLVGYMVRSKGTPSTPQADDDPPPRD